MLSLASKAIKLKKGIFKRNNRVSSSSSDCFDDEPSLNTNSTRQDEGLECPICWESFNVVENVPCVLWCGHTLCKNCVLGLQRAIVKLPTLPIYLPFFISCPWCNLFSFRFVYKGTLRFPRKNYFLLGMVESLNGDRSKSSSCVYKDHKKIRHHQNQQEEEEKEVVGSADPDSGVGNLVGHIRPNHDDEGRVNVGYFNGGRRIHLWVRKSLVLFVRLTAKFPLIVVFLLIVLYAIPASAAVLAVYAVITVVFAVYVVITVVFALPSFLVLYLALPSLDWLVREIIT